MNEYNEKTAQKYDKALYVFLHRIRKKVVELAKELKVEKIADLCCGTGNQLKYFKEAGFKDIIGVDLSPDMLKVATERYKLQCLNEDATATSLPSDYYDMVMISFALHEKPLETAKKIIDEARRILKKDGYLFLVDYYHGKGAFFIGKLGATAVEAMVGGEHYQNYKNYREKGGFEYLMPGEKPLIIKPFLFGAVQLRAYKISN